MEQLILIFHVLAALAIIGLIMLQQGKGADMGASFGSGASQTLFGSSGSGNALTKATTLLVTVFFTTSFGLAVIAKNMSVSSVEIDIPVAVEAVSNTPLSDVPGASDMPAFDGLPVANDGQQGSDLDIPATENVSVPALSTEAEDIP